MTSLANRLGNLVCDAIFFAIPVVGFAFLAFLVYSVAVASI